MRYFVLSLLLLSNFALISQNKIDKGSFSKAIASFESSDPFIILGEAHNVVGTYETELFIIQQMYPKGYHTIFIEGGWAEAFLLNKYIETKDENLLQYSRAKNKHYRELIDGIGEIEGPESIEFVGVDFERRIGLEFVFGRWFKEISNQELAPFSKILKDIKSGTSPKKVKKAILQAKEVYSEYEQVLKTELGAEERYLQQIIYNPVFEVDFAFGNKKRDLQISENLMRHQDFLSESIFIIGSNHLTNPRNLWLYFQEKMKDDLNAMVFLFGYQNCKNLQKKGKFFNSIGIIKDYFEPEDASKHKVEFVLKKGSFLSPQEEEVDFIFVKCLNL